MTELKYEKSLFGAIFSLFLAYVKKKYYLCPKIATVWLKTNRI